jgi:Tfp pilus assembly protein PilO
MNERRQLAIAAGAAVFVALLFFMILLRPKMSQLSETRRQIDALKLEEETLRSNLGHLQDVRRDAPLAAAKLLAVSQLLPSTADLPGFIRLIQDAATAAGADLQSIAPTAPVTLLNATGVQSVNVTLVVKGGFRRIEDFLSRVENLRRVVVVTAVSLAPEVDPLSSQTSLQATLSVQMFVAQDGAVVSPGAAPAPAASPSPSASGAPR